MPFQSPSGDLARAMQHDMDDAWPAVLDIVAYYGSNGRKGRSRRVTISADQFFGRGGYGAPMSGDEFIRILNQLRKG